MPRSNRKRSKSIVLFIYNLGARGMGGQGHALAVLPQATRPVRDRRLLPRLNWNLPSLGLSCGVWWFETDVSALSICPILKGQFVEAVWPLKIKSIGSTETSVLNHLTPRNNPEDGRIKGPATHYIGAWVVLGAGIKFNCELCYETRSMWKRNTF
jgi:hypothetical protein